MNREAESRPFFVLPIDGEGKLDIADHVADLRLRLLTTTYLERAHYYHGEYVRAIELATENLAALPSDWVFEPFAGAAPTSVDDRRWLVMSLAQIGRFAEASIYEAEALRLAESTQHALTIGVASLAAGTLHLLKGDWGEARDCFARATAMFRAANVVAQLPYVVASSTWVLAQLGEASEARARLSEGEGLVERLEALGQGRHLAPTFHALGRACVLLDRLDVAHNLGSRMLESSGHQHGFIAHALSLLGDIATHPGHFHVERGEEYYRKALVLAEPRGMRPLIAHCHLGLGRLYRRTARAERACEHLGTAMTMYRAMEMSYWLEQAEGEAKAPV